MGRKRLLAILAGAVAAVGLHMGPAVALDSSLDTSSLDAVFDGVDPKIVEKCEDEDTIALIEKCVEEAEASLSDSKDEVETKSGDTTTTTKKTTEKTTDTVKESTKSTPDSGTDEPSSTTKESPSSSGDSSTSTSTSSTSSSSSGSSSSGVTAAGSAGSAERPDALSPEEARQFLAGSRDSVDISGPRGDVTPAFDLSGSNGDLADPLIAAPSAPADGTSDNEWQAASPETAPPRSDAELAAIPGQSPNEVPAGLKLIAGLLVAGTGTLWHLTRRELQPVKA
jgi:hypothetical protein